MTRTSPYIAMPKTSQFDDKTDIAIHGLPPNRLVTIYAVVPTSTDVVFESFAIYKSSEAGTVDLTKDSSQGGFYTGVEPMGLFWSMQSFSQTKKNGIRFACKDARNHRVYDFCVIDREIQQVDELRALHKANDDRFVAKITVQRRFMAKGVRRIEINEGGLYGVLFLPEGDGPFPGILNLFGGFPGVLEFKSALHASHGFASLTLCYFGEKGMPKSFTNTLDLAYFEKAVQFLKNHPAVQGELGIGLVGICKGAQVVLAMASCLDDIRCTVWVNCSINAACGSIEYKDLYWPQMPMKTDVEVPDGPIALADCYDVPEEGEFINKVDGIFPFYNRHDVSFLFIAGNDDCCAPAKKCAREADILLSRAEHPDFEVAYYEDAGHMLEPPYSPHCSVLFQPGPTFDINLKCGGELVAHCKAQEHCWHKQMSFLKTRLQ